MQVFSTDSKTGRLLSALQSGEALTEGQIRQRFGLKNPRASVSDIRYAGFAVYANQRRDSKGRTTTKYVMGRPSRRLIAAGYKAMALGIV